MPFRNKKIHKGTNTTSQKTPTYVAKKSTPITKVYASTTKPSYPRPTYGGCGVCGKKLPKR